VRGDGGERPKIFNFSFSLEKFSDDSLKEIRNVFIKNEEDARNALFVVAAGNDGEDLEQIESLPFITWVEKFRDVLLGVGATTRDGLSFCQKRRSNPLKNDDDIKVSNCGRIGVEIAAPGEGVLSLAAGNAYAATDGSSQAVPWVTAAAAMLFAQNSQFQASAVKARLLYTADWVSNDFARCVWSGRLNVRRAVWKPDRVTYRTKADTGTVRTADFKPSAGMSLTVLDAEPDDPMNEAPKPTEIPFRDVLRLASMSDGLYRVFYLREGKFAVAKNAHLQGTIDCKKEEQWQPGQDEKPGRFVPSEWPECGRDLSEFLYDYVAPVPRDVKFAKGRP
jgi:hypothetical protein